MGFPQITHAAIYQLRRSNFEDRLNYPLSEHFQNLLPPKKKRRKKQKSIPFAHKYMTILALNRHLN
jgi:hypothetical protein